MNPWTIEFSTPDEAARVTKIMRVYLYNPNITGPDPETGLIRYFPWTPETEQQVEELFSGFGNPVKITPPEGNERRVQEYETFRLNNSFEELLETGNYSDLTLIVEGISFKVHKAILASVSDYFNVMFQKFKEAGKNEIILEGISPEAFSGLLKIIYGPGVRYDDPVFLPILVQARFLQIKGIDYDIASRADLPEDIQEYIEMMRYIFPDKIPDSIVELLEDSGYDPNKFPEDIAKVMKLKRAQSDLYYNILNETHQERLQKYS